MQKNKMSLTFDSIIGNEAFARNVVASFCLSLNPTVDEIIEIKTAVSEAVTNSIIHGYPNKIGKIKINASIIDNSVYISIKDKGNGIKDIKKALEPFYTSKPDDERTGMGFTVMESFMNNVEVKNNKDHGLTVNLVKIIGKKCIKSL